VSENLPIRSSWLARVRRTAPWSVGAAVIGLVVVYYVPYVVPAYQLALLASAAAAAVAILGLNILFGYTGQTSHPEFCQAATVCVVIWWCCQAVFSS